MFPDAQLPPCITKRFEGSLAAAPADSHVLKWPLAQLGVERRKEALGESVVPTVAFAAHAADKAKGQLGIRCLRTGCPGRCGALDPAQDAAFAAPSAGPKDTGCAPASVPSTSLPPVKRIDRKAPPGRGSQLHGKVGRGRGSAKPPRLTGGAYDSIDILFFWPDRCLFPQRSATWLAWPDLLHHGSSGVFFYRRA